MDFIGDPCLKTGYWMDKGKRIAFIRPKAWPLANRIVEGVLKEQFPDQGVDLIDISTLVRRRPDLVLVNSIATTLLYGKHIAQGRKQFRLAFWRTPFIFRQVRRLVQKRVAEGTYAFTFQMQSLFDASTPGIPHFVYTDHTHLENRHYVTGAPNLYSPHWIALEKQIYQNAAITFLRSSNVRRSLIEDYGCPAEKAVLVYAGSNAKVSRVKTKDTDYAKPVILFVGLDWKRKGGPDLVEAFRLVRQEIPGARLTIVGASPDLQVPGCEVVGKVPPEQLNTYYQEADIFCLPTYLEPFGIAFIEAMTAHLPVVATRVGAIPDFVEQERNGILVEPGDIPGIARALLRLLKDPQLRRSFGEHSFQLTWDRYSWQAVGAKFRHNILRVLGEPEPPRRGDEWNVEQEMRQ
jgi:glycosyltransferase involved in cell wall biosynthesis